jgi:hypothetical protein
MAHPVAAPHMWERILPGISQYLGTAVEQQRVIENHVKAGDIESLAKTHSNASSDDPCNIAPFLFADTDKDVHRVKELEKAAEDSKLDNLKSYADARTRIADMVAKSNALDLPELAGALNLSRVAESEKVKAFSDVLEDIVSPDRGKRKGRDEVLRKAGVADVNTMQEEAKSKAFKQVRVMRISQRAAASLAAVKCLSEDEAWKAKLNNAAVIRTSICAEGEASVGMLHQGVRGAVEDEAEIDEILVGLRTAFCKAEDQLTKCKAHKLAVDKKHDAKRADLIKALQQLQDADKAFRNSHVENETARLQVTRLDQSIASTKVRLDAVLVAAPLAKGAWQQRRQHLKIQVQQLNELVEVETLGCMERAAEPIRVVALNLQVVMALGGAKSRRFVVCTCVFCCSC